MPPQFLWLVSGGAEEAGMKGWRGRAADVFTDQGEIAAKMKSAPGPGTTDLGYSTTPHPTKGVRPRARSPEPRNARMDTSALVPAFTSMQSFFHFPP